MKTRTALRIFHINRMAKSGLIQGRHQPAFRRLPLPMVTIRRNRLKTQKPLLRSCQASDRSTRRLKFKRIREDGLRNLRNGVAEDWRAVRRSCQAILQAIWWPCRKDDPDKSVRPTPRCQTKISLLIPGDFFIIITQFV